MRSLTILFTLGLLTNLYSQSHPALENVLAKEFSANSTEDGRWVFNPKYADIEKIEKPLVETVLPNYDFYKVIMTNYLGYHVNQGTCLVLFDSLKSDIILVEPLWFGGISEPLIKLFLKKQFDNQAELLAFFNELNELMETGSSYKFINTSSSDNTITYDLVYLNGDVYTTGGNGTSSTIKYTSDGVWRQITIKIKDFQPIEYESVNPKLKDDKEMKKEYKQTIK